MYNYYNNNSDNSNVNDNDNNYDDNHDNNYNDNHNNDNDNDNNCLQTDHPLTLILVFQIELLFHPHNHNLQLNSI